MGDVMGLPSWVAVIVFVCIALVVSVVAYYFRYKAHLARLRDDFRRHHSLTRVDSMKAVANQAMYDRNKGQVSSTLMQSKESMSPEKEEHRFDERGVLREDSLDPPPSTVVGDDFAKITDPEDLHARRESQHIVPSFICPITQEIS